MHINKTVLLVIVVLAAILLTGAWISGGSWSGAPMATSTPNTVTTTTQTSSKGTTQTTKSTKTTASAPAPEPSYYKGSNSINTLLGLDPASASYTCSFSTQSPYRSGTFVLGGRKWRGDFGGTSMIDDGQYIYLWQAGATTGLKVLAKSGAALNAVVTKGGIDPYASLTYSCSAWRVDTARFTPPALSYTDASGFPAQ